MFDLRVFIGEESILLLNGELIVSPLFDLFGDELSDTEFKFCGVQTLLYLDILGILRNLAEGFKLYFF